MQVQEKRVVVLGAGIAGHTAAMFLRRRLPRNWEVRVVSPNAHYNWIPSNIWVGVGLLPARKVLVPLEPIYRRTRIAFTQARATEIHPEGGRGHEKPYVVVQPVAPGSDGQAVEIEYDYLVNATGPKLNFGATPGLGPEGHSLSVCTAQHAEHAAAEFRKALDRLAHGERLTFVVGTGHGQCTCEGAAFEYVFNVEFEIRKRGLRDRARIVYLTNEAELGDFGVGGLNLEVAGYVVPSRIFTESLFVERGVEWVLGAHVQRVEQGRVYWEDLQGEEFYLDFDFAMLLPPFRGADLRAFDRHGADITSKLFAPSGFMKVDADYTPKPYEEWSPRDWPSTYQNPDYPNVFAVGIAFAPPHPITPPRANPKGTPISPAPPRTGMPSAIMGRAVAESIADMVRGRSARPTHRASLAELGAACVASAGYNPFTGSAAAMTMYPIVPDYEKYPVTGRSKRDTFGEIGSAGHWIKIVLHHMFLYKARALPGWWLIPE
ncbi:MAG TPA: sulfide:quinone reductase [Armatimonadetes bacterium]|nr:sulfide:quinone reductase [Armatimonadota bacterium]